MLSILSNLSSFSLGILICLHLYLGRFTNVYFDYPHLDILMHATGAMLIAIPLYNILWRFNKCRIAYGVLLIFFISVIWEIIEFSYSLFIKNNFYRDFNDTFKDLVVTTVMGALSLFFMSQLHKKVKIKLQNETETR